MSPQAEANPQPKRGVTYNALRWEGPIHFTRPEGLPANCHLPRRAPTVQHGHTRSEQDIYEVIQAGHKIAKTKDGKFWIVDAGSYPEIGRKANYSESTVRRVVAGLAGKLSIVCWKMHLPAGHKGTERARRSYLIPTKYETVLEERRAKFGTDRGDPMAPPERRKPSIWVKDGQILSSDEERTWGCTPAYEAFCERRAKQYPQIAPAANVIAPGKFSGERRKPTPLGPTDDERREAAHAKNERWMQHGRPQRLKEVVAALAVTMQSSRTSDHPELVEAKALIERESTIDPGLMQEALDIYNNLQRGPPGE